MTTHAAIGAFIGARIGNPVLGFIIGLASHFLVDTIPHGDSKHVQCYYHGHTREKRRWLRFLLIDACAATSLVLILLATRTSTQRLVFSLAMIGSILPDPLVGYYELTKSRFVRPVYRLHFLFHNALSKRVGDIPLRYALVVQAVVVFFIVVRLR